MRIASTQLTEATLLGQYAEPDGWARDEYQLGTRLVWLYRKADESAEHARAGAAALFSAAWADVAAVVDLAAQASRALLPDLWLQYDQTTRGGTRLAVWGITLKPFEGLVSYEVGENLDFDAEVPTFHLLDVFEEAPLKVEALPREHRIHVQRSPDGSLRIAAAR
ncbi:MAG: hypothetical protein JSR41_12160 [Proteobacteria bacterium]|nr:hypothetical protein [Pseudomonadota bacterium]